MVALNFYTLKNTTDAQKLGLLIAAATIVRLFFAQIGLGTDESYTVATGRELSLSVFDHPPMAWWLVWLVQKLFGSDLPFLVRLPFVMLSGIATWQMYRLTSLLFGNRAGLIAALAFVCAPALGMTSGTFVLPDGPLIVGLLGGAICLARLSFESEQDGWLWLAAGFWGGIALLSKYHGVFLFFGAGLFVVSTRSMRHWIFSPMPYLGVLVSLIVFSPVLVWNSDHNWISLTFQGGRFGKLELHPLNPLVTILVQAIFLLPSIWIAVVVATLSAIRAGSHDSKRWFLLCLGLPQILLFTLGSTVASSKLYFHWAMPGYLLLLPLLGDWISRKFGDRGNLIERLSVATAVTVAGLVAIVVFAWHEPELTQLAGFKRDPLLDLRELDDVNEYLAARGLLGRDGVVVGPIRWHTAGKFDYALKGRLRVTCLCEDARQYGITAPLNEMMGKDFIIPLPVRNVDDVRAMLAPSFGSLQRLDNLIIRKGSLVLEEFAIFYGKDFRSLPGAVAQK